MRFLSQFQDAGDLILADFEEDDDVGTGTLNGVSIDAHALALWREQELSLKWHKAGTAAAIMGWQSGSADAEENEEPAWYALTLPEMALTPEWTLNLSLAPSTAHPGEVEDYEPPQETDFSIMLKDAHGNTAAVALSVRRALVETVEPRVFKLHALQEDVSEIVLQRYRFELSEWQRANPNLVLSALTELKLVFDQTPTSSIILQQVALSSRGL